MKQNHSVPKHKGEGFLYSDIPILCKENDELNRARFAQMIGDIILSPERAAGLCIGLMGTWGSGKTSLLNLAEEYIKSKPREQNVDVLRFEPWNFSSPEQIFSQFFLQLAELFHAGDSEKGKVGKAIRDYANSIEASAFTSLIGASSPFGALISGAIKFALGKAGEMVGEMEFANKSLQKQKDEVEQLLENTEDKILIIIDDIDRLTDNQIRCVFQLVTVVCKFPNIVYLLAFDRDIVVKALDRLQINRGNEYLDKIIQVPITVPRIDKNRLFSIMADRLNAIIKENKIEVSDQKRWSLFYSYCVERLIQTPRDVSRLCNGVQSKLALIANEVDFQDLLVLTILEQHEPGLYEWMKLHDKMLTGQFSYESKFDAIVYGKQDVTNNRKEKYKAEIDNLLLHKERFTSDMALDTLCVLFSAFAVRIGMNNQYVDKDVLRERNSIGHPDKFERYFSIGLSEEQISNTDIGFIIERATETEIKNTILEKDKRNAVVELFDELKARRQRITQDRKERLIIAIADIGEDLESESSNGLFPRHAFIEAANLINEFLLLFEESNRYAILARLIESMSPSNANFISCLLYRVFVAHKVIGDGDSSSISEEYPRVGSESEANQLKEQYEQKVKEIINCIPVLELPVKDWLINVYKWFPGGKEELKMRMLSDPCAVLIYLDSKFGHMRAIGDADISEIRVTEHYTEFFSDEHVEQAINRSIENHTICSLDHKVLRSIAAYQLVKKGGEFQTEIDVETLDRKVQELLPDFVND